MLKELIVKESTQQWVGAGAIWGPGSDNLQTG